MRPLIACLLLLLSASFPALATNITVQMNPEGAEDRITVLRGMDL